jgi:hypothetical protein
MDMRFAVFILSLVPAFSLMIAAHANDPPAPTQSPVPFDGVKSDEKGEGILPKRLALIIGINEYERIDDSTGAELHSGIEMPTLINAEADATNIRDLLKTQAEFTTILLTTKKGDSTNPTRYIRRVDILNALDKLKSEADESAKIVGATARPFILFFWTRY